MGYDIYWWRYKPNAKNLDHFRTLERFTLQIDTTFLEGEITAKKLETLRQSTSGATKNDIPNLQLIPTKKIISRIESDLSTNLIQAGSTPLTVWEGSWEMESGAFQVSLQRQYASFSGYGDWGDENLGKLVEIFSEFNCPAFDPQTGERHGKDHPS